MQEIERKFLVDTNIWNPVNSGISLKQGYLSTDPDRVVRVRISDKEAFLTIKGKTKGISRTEMEYSIPLEEAEILLTMCLHNPIIKTRYIENIGGYVWEIDVFENGNKGLVLAEIELNNENQKFDLPSWAIKEVSYDHRYFNAWLSKNPFSTW